MAGQASGRESGGWVGAGRVRRPVGSGRGPVNDLLVAKDQVSYEQLAYWRNPMAAVFTFMFPVIFLIVVGTSAGSAHVPGTTLHYDQYTVVAMLVFGLSAACYTNLAMPSASVATLGC